MKIIYDEHKPYVFNSAEDTQSGRGLYNDRIVHTGENLQRKQHNTHESARGGVAGILIESTIQKQPICQPSNRQKPQRGFA